MKLSSRIAIASPIVFLSVSMAVTVQAAGWITVGTDTYTTDNVGIGTTSPSYKLDGVATGTGDGFRFTGSTTTVGERDTFTVYDNDPNGVTQDESSILKVIRDRFLNDGADGYSLLELTHNATLPSVDNRHFYMVGRAGAGSDEGQLAWGIGLTNADFWTSGSVRGGATGTDCGGTGADCFNSPTFVLSADSDSYINGGNLGIGTASPGNKLDIESGHIEMDSEYGLIWGSGADAEYMRRVASDSLSFGTQNTERIRVDSSGNIGIGTSSPSAQLHLSGDDGALFEGTYGTGSVTASGAGTRLMWYPGKAAFRAGYVGDTQWDDASIGNYSVAMGAHTIASNEGSVSLGYGNQATGEYATAFGFDNDATANQSVAMGGNNHATGGASVAMGDNNTASGYVSTVLGANSTASGQFATAIGYSTTAQAYHSFVVGRFNTVTGNTSTWTATDPLFVVGNGSSSSSTNDALVVTKDGSVGIGTSSPSAGLHVSDTDGALFTGTIGSGSIPTTGAGTRMMWYPSKAAFRVGAANGTEWDASNVGTYSVATGAWTTASGVSSVAMGDNVEATGDYSTAFGFYTSATGNGAFATGDSTNADGKRSAAFNNNTDVDADYASAFGYGTAGESYASLVLGRYNTSTGDNTSWISTDPIFVIGNGTSSGARSDAFVIDKDGTIAVTGDITSDGEICIGSGC